MMTTDPIIQLKEVHKAFQANRVLQGVDLAIYPGEVTSIIGQSGGGKSVLLKHIIGLMQPDAGSILFRGQPLSAMSYRDRRQLKGKFSYMFQGSALFDSMTVYENIALPLKEKTALTDAVIREKVHKKMDQLDLGQIEKRYPAQLSGGMKKRVALARALITEPEIVLFDEPTTGLDPVRKNAVHHMIADYQRQFKFTGVIVSHEIPDIFYISQRIAMLYDGNIIFEGSPSAIQNTTDKVIQQFLQGQDPKQDTDNTMATRLAVEARFDEEMERLRFQQNSFSLVVFSLENLDEINRQGGFVAAQRVLENFLSEIKRHLSLNDTCYRYGMNKILLFLLDKNKAQSHSFCEGLAGKMQKNRIIDIDPYPGFCFKVSMGFAIADKNAHLDDLLVRATSDFSRFCDIQVC